MSGTPVSRLALAAPRGDPHFSPACGRRQWKRRFIGKACLSPGRRCGSPSCEFTPADRETSSRRHSLMKRIFALLLAFAWTASGQLPKETQSDAGIDVHLSVRPFGKSTTAVREG